MSASEDIARPGETEAGDERSAFVEVETIRNALGELAVFVGTHRGKPEQETMLVGKIADAAVALEKIEQRVEVLLNVENMARFVDAQIDIRGGTVRRDRVVLPEPVSLALLELHASLGKLK